MFLELSRGGSGVSFGEKRHVAAWNLALWLFHWDDCVRTYATVTDNEAIEEETQMIDAVETVWQVVRNISSKSDEPPRIWKPAKCQLPGVP